MSDQFDAEFITNLIGASPDDLRQKRLSEIKQQETSAFPVAEADDGSLFAFDPATNPQMAAIHARQQQADTEFAQQEDDSAAIEAGLGELRAALQEFDDYYFAPGREAAVQVYQQGDLSPRTQHALAALAMAMGSGEVIWEDIPPDIQGIVRRVMQSPIIDSLVAGGQDFVSNTDDSTGVAALKAGGAAVSDLVTSIPARFSDNPPEPRSLTEVEGMPAWAGITGDLLVGGADALVHSNLLARSLANRAPEAIAQAQGVLEQANYNIRIAAQQDIIARTLADVPEVAALDDEAFNGLVTASTMFGHNPKALQSFLEGWFEMDTPTATRISESIGQAGLQPIPVPPSFEFDFGLGLSGGLRRAAAGRPDEPVMVQVPDGPTLIYSQSQVMQDTQIEEMLNFFNSADYLSSIRTNTNGEAIDPDLITNVITNSQGKAYNQVASELEGLGLSHHGARRLMMESGLKQPSQSIAVQHGRITPIGSAAVVETIVDENGNPAIQLEQLYHATRTEAGFPRFDPASRGGTGGKEIHGNVIWLARHPDVTMTATMHGSALGSDDYRRVVNSQEFQEWSEELAADGVRSFRIAAHSVSLRPQYTTIRNPYNMEAMPPDDILREILPFYEQNYGPLGNPELMGQARGVAASVLGESDEIEPVVSALAGSTTYRNFTNAVSQSSSAVLPNPNETRELWNGRVWNRIMPEAQRIFLNGRGDANDLSFENVLMREYLGEDYFQLGGYEAHKLAKALNERRRGAYGVIAAGAHQDWGFVEELKQMFDFQEDFLASVNGRFDRVSLSPDNQLYPPPAAIPRDTDASEAVRLADLKNQIETYARSGQNSHWHEKDAYYHFLRERVFLPTAESEQDAVDTLNAYLQAKGYDGLTALSTEAPSSVVGEDRRIYAIFRPEDVLNYDDVELAMAEGMRNGTLDMNDPENARLMELVQRRSDRGIADAETPSVTLGGSPHNFDSSHIAHNMSGQDWQMFFTNKVEGWNELPEHLRNSFVAGMMGTEDGLNQAFTKDYFESFGLYIEPDEIFEMYNALGDVDDVYQKGVITLGEGLSDLTHSTPTNTLNTNTSINVDDANEIIDADFKPAGIGNTLQHYQSPDELMAYKPTMADAQPGIGTSMKMAVRGDIVMAEQISGQAGTNPGGLYRGSDGTERYVKFYDDPDQTLSEMVANRLYMSGSGVPAPPSEIITDPTNGRLAIATEYIGGDSRTFREFASTATPEEIQPVAEEFLRGMFLDGVLMNWDVVGMEFDNIVVSPNGTPWRIDNGSSFLKRAMGSDKDPAFVGSMTEFETFQDPNIAPTYAQMIQHAGWSEEEVAQQLHTQATRFLDDLQESGHATWEDFVMEELRLHESMGDEAVARYAEFLRRRTNLALAKINEMNDMSAFVTVLHPPLK